MRAKFSSRLHNLMVLLILLTVALVVSSCRSNEVEVPPLIGDSGHHLFLTIHANPDHLVIHEPGRPREQSDISIQLKNQQGQGVPGENLKLRILNIAGNEVAIGRLSDFNDRTDGAGFVRVTYTAPDTSELLGATSVVIEAILTNAAYPREVTDHHEIELQGSGPSPGDCSSGGLVPAGDITVSPANPVVNQTVCFNGITAFPTAVDFTWDFNGDGKADATGANACTTFNSAATFQVTLLARTLDHDCGTATTVVTVGPGTPATCTIVTSPSQVLIGDTVNFTAITADPDGRVRRFVWNFGDGKSSSSSRNTITHSYDRAGAFTVVLTITDDQGNVSTCQTAVTVSEEQQGAPVCAFTVSPNNIIANTSVVSANGSASTDADGTIDQYTVDWGDGTFDTLSCPGGSCPTPTGLPIIPKGGAGTYATQGDFTVTLVVRDNDGLTSTCTQQVTVCPTTGCGPTLAECSDNLDNDGDGCVDFSTGAGGDPSCASAADTSESPVDAACTTLNQNKH